MGVYLMKNKKVFNVNKINLNKFAESLGLATTPRVRFLERQEKNNVKQIKGDGFIGLDKEKQEELGEKKEDETSTREGGDSISLQNEDDDSDDEIFTVKRKDHTIDDDKDESADAL